MLKVVLFAAKSGYVLLARFRNASSPPALVPSQWGQYNMFTHAPAIFVLCIKYLRQCQQKKWHDSGGAQFHRRAQLSVIISHGRPQTSNKKLAGWMYTKHVHCYFVVCFTPFTLIATRDATSKFRKIFSSLLMQIVDTQS